MFRQASAFSILIISLGLMFTSVAALAASQLSFPGEAPRESVTSAMKKAEAAYSAGDFKTAFWYFRKELAPLGDKYAQYMVGHMLEHGEGVNRDKEAAAAWYMLAAERGHQDIVNVSQQFQQSLSSDQLSSVRQQAISLKTDIGDRALIERLIRRDVDKLNNMTGSRVANGRSSCARSVRVYDPRDLRGSVSVDRFCKTLNARIEKRMQYLGGYVEFGELELLPDEAMNNVKKDDESQERNADETGNR